MKRGTLHRRGFAWLLLGLLCCVPLVALAQDLPPLQGAWMPAEPAMSAEPPDSAAEAGMQHFDPERLQVFSPEASWVLLWPRDGAWPEAPFVLEIEGAGFQALVLHGPSPGAVRTAQTASGDQAWPAHGRLAFAIAQAPPDNAPLRLQVISEGAVAAPMTFSLRTTVAYLRADARWLGFASACLAIMVAMSLVAVFFAIRLKDHTFGFYAGFVLSYAMILGMQTGYVFEPLGWAPSIALLHAVARLATAASVVFAVLFVDRFANLRRHVPRGRRLLLGYAAVVGMLGVAALVPGLDRVARMLVNPLLIVGGPAVLVVAALALLRGSRYAAFFLVGWVPLLAATVVGSLQVYGFLAGWNDAGDAALAAGAFEAMMLSLGLADRSLALRHDRDRAQRLADIDSLTGLYNRRAWSERLMSLHAQTQRAGQPLSLLFLDLDGFKDSTTGWATPRATPRCGRRPR